MLKDKIRLGVMPTRRDIFSYDTAKEEYDRIMPMIKAQMTDYVEYIDVEDVLETGMGTYQKDIKPVVEKFKEANIDALFFPFCDFGSEETVVGVAKAFKVPTLMWGSRDILSTYEKRGRETQCGMFAAGKVLRNYGVTFSYIWNCEADSQDYVNGFEKFIKVANVLKALKNLNVAEIGDRPAAFYSVIHSQLQLIRHFNISVKPIQLKEVTDLTNKIMMDNSDEYQKYVADFSSRVDCTEAEGTDYVARLCAGKMAIQQLMDYYECRCVAFDCKGIRDAIGLPGSACAIEGELADAGYPTACECDVWGAISALINYSATLGESSSFVADWTIRHPENDNAELLWHNGSFAWSLGRKDVPAKIKKFVGRTNLEPHWELKKGNITMLRLDELNGKYYMFCGEGRACDGGETSGTYGWFETDNWKRWEEKLMLGPWIHHVSGTYGNHFEVIREVVKYLNDPERGVCVELDYPERDGGWGL